MLYIAKLSLRCRELSCSTLEAEIFCFKISLLRFLWVKYMYNIVKKNMNAQKIMSLLRALSLVLQSSLKTVYKNKNLSTSIMAANPFCHKSACNVLFSDVTEVLVRSHHPLRRFQFAEGSFVVNNLIMSKTFRPSIR